MATLLDSKEYIPVSNFFHDRSVFITGATGFLGKVLLEKLLRSCPGIKNVYLLIRMKRGQKVADRLEEVTNSPLFDVLRKERSSDMNKIVPIEGDLMEPELGINQSDQNLIIRNVSVVFHCAATVKFDEMMKTAIIINLLGTKRILELSQRIQGLEAFVHVSTAFANCNRQVINEFVYPSSYEPEMVLQFAECLDDDLLNILTPKLLNDRPNTYTFTKALAENLLLKEGGNVPIAIVRPSVILSSYQEPTPGFVDSTNGATGLMSANGKGMFYSIHGYGNYVADLIPVDMVVNTIICAAWRTATSRPYGLMVYNCCSGNQKPISWNKFVDACNLNFREFPLSNVILYPNVSCTSNWALNLYFEIIFHKIPAYLLDLVLKVIGKRQVFVRMHLRINKAANVLKYFIQHEWYFKDDNLRHLQSMLSYEDSQTFQFAVSSIDWSPYIKNYILGIRKFIFKENSTTLPQARKHLRRILWMHRFIKFCTLFLVCRAAMSHSKVARRVMYTLFNLILRLVSMLHIV